MLQGWSGPQSRRVPDDARGLVLNGQSRFHVVVPAAGLGIRYAGPQPKQWCEVAGSPVLAWTIRRLSALAPASLVVVVARDRLDAASSQLGVPGVRWVAGGATRAASVLAGLGALEATDNELVAVHDGARPAVDLDDFRRVVGAAAISGAAILGRPIADTVKRLAAGWVTGTVDRRELGQAETPQVARFGLLLAALADHPDVTDEASALEAAGIDVAWVEATRPNPKLTRAGDEVVLAALLEQSMVGLAW